MPSAQLARHLAASSDLPPWAIGLAVLLSACNLVMLVLEMRRRERGGAALALTGALAILALLVAVLRPVTIAARESVVGARVVVLFDASRSMALPAGSGTRSSRRDEALATLVRSEAGARLLPLGFGEGPPRPRVAQSPPRDRRSDLAAALRALAASADERPAAVVVVSDGRLDDPPEGATEELLKSLHDVLRVPIHTVAVADEPLPDASVRRVVAAGAAVAHVPMPLRVEVGCTGGLSCDELAVTVRELRDDGPPALLGSGLVHLHDGVGAIDLTVTLERAGARLLDVSITPPSGDTVPENDRRILTFDVARERVRVLHVAGRPTNDVRALRQWLKSDASIDVVAFFILRTQSDNTNAVQEDLALIPFPVDELFSEHLPSFDAVVLQDFDAQPYGLEKHLPALGRYVRAGGGLIMIGGPNSFVAGGYAGTELGKVLPVELDESSGATAADPAPFVPVFTAAGRAAPLLAPLRAIVGEELPTMPGTNVLGPVSPGGVALWTHPTRTLRNGTPMPVLAVADQGDGRTIALGVDGGWMLEFSALGARTAGRGHGALWDGLLGWLMRDPRFEPAQLEIVGGCTAGLPTTLRAQLFSGAGGAEGPVKVDVTRIDAIEPGGAAITPPLHLVGKPVAGGTAGVVEVQLPALPAGGYTARLHAGPGSSTRKDFACEAGGDEWADSRPDPERLRAIAHASGGEFIAAGASLRGITLPKPTVVSAERHVIPLAPPWLWAALAAFALGLHWFTRRRSGLT